MGRITQTRLKYRGKKSNFVKDGSGHYHCATCGAFVSVGKSKKKKK